MKKNSIIKSVLISALVISLVGSEAIVVSANQTQPTEVTAVPEVKGPADPYEDFDEVARIGDYFCGKRSGYITILEYWGKDVRDLVVPDTLDGFPVKKIDETFFDSCAWDSVFIPLSVEEVIDKRYICTRGSTDLISIVVDERNEHLSSLGGVLYNKDMTELIACPDGIKKVVIPDSVKAIRRFAISNYSGDTVIIANSGSYAQTFAKKNNYDYIDLKDVAADYGKYTVSYAEDIESQPFYFLPPEDGVYVFKSYSDNDFTISYPAFNAWTRIESENIDIFKLNKLQIFDFEIKNAASDVAIEVFSVDEIAAKDYGVYNISYDGKPYKDFVFMAKADGVYTFTFQSNADFGVYPHEVFTEISPVASGNEKQIHRIAVELKKDESYVFAMMDITSDISVTIGDTISSDFYYPVSIGETTPEYTFSNYHLTLSRIGGLGSFVSAWDSDLYDFRGLIKHVTLNEGVSEINYHTFYNFNNMETVFIPDTVTYIDELAFTYEYWEPSYDENGNVISYGLTDKNIDNLTIYGYSGSYAETYANEMGFAFVAVEKIKDKTSGIEVKGKLDSKTKLKVNDISVEEIELDDENREVKACYDITLLKGKKEVQPEIPVIVMIPYSGTSTNMEVYRLNDDGTKDKMIFTFDGSYISFVTDHFSKYIVVGDAGILGDANGDGVADIADSLMISRYDAGLITLDYAKVVMSDVNNDGSADIADALKIARYDAGLIDSLS